MNIAVCALFVLVLIYALVSNHDVVSPAKFYLFSFATFHLGALTFPAAYELWCLIFLVLLVGVWTVFYEALTAPPSVDWPPELRALRRGVERPFALWLWFLSVPALLAQVYIVQRFGGLQGYINTLAFRVIEFRGFGWVRVLTSTMILLNLVYFAIGLTRSRTRRWWLLYVLHSLLLLVIGLLSGSRGGILNVFAMQFLIYHYLHKRVRLAVAVPAAVILLALAVVLGIARSGFKVDEGHVRTGLDSAGLFAASTTFFYGVTPIKLLTDADHLKLAHGSTFVSLLTNSVPRGWWPEKPDTGGVYFTKVYTGDEWDGASNLTPSYLGEWVMNFGWLSGILGFVVTYPAIMIIVVRRYNRAMAQVRRDCDAAAAVDIVQYICLMWGAVALMTGEITNVVLTVAITQIIPLVFLKRLVAGSQPAPLARIGSGPAILAPHAGS